MKGTYNMLRPSTTVKTAHPDASRALEEAWRRRRRELADWRPSKGWLAEPETLTKRVAATRS